MKEFLEFAKKYGAIVALVITLFGWGITWGSMSTRVTEHEEEITELKEENKTLRSDNHLMYKELKTNVEELTESVATISGILSVQ